MPIQDSKNNYIVTYEKIYNYNDYTTILVVLFIILFTIYFFTVIQKVN
jgi:hypothetical protein